MSGEMDSRVTAIRQDPRVGKGTCTHIDECFDDKDLVERLDGLEISTPEAAVDWAHEEHGFRLEMALNYSSGERDCPHRKAWFAWRGEEDDE